MKSPFGSKTTPLFYLYQDDGDDDNVADVAVVVEDPVDDDPTPSSLTLPTTMMRRPAPPPVLPWDLPSLDSFTSRSSSTTTSSTDPMPTEHLQGRRTAGNRPKRNTILTLPYCYQFDTNRPDQSRQRQDHQEDEEEEEEEVIFSSMTLTPEDLPSSSSCTSVIRMMETEPYDVEHHHPHDHPNGTTVDVEWFNASGVWVNPYPRPGPVVWTSSASRCRARWMALVIFMVILLATALTFDTAPTAQYEAAQQDQYRSNTTTNNTNATTSDAPPLLPPMCLPPPPSRFVVWSRISNDGTDDDDPTTWGLSWQPTMSNSENHHPGWMGTDDAMEQQEAFVDGSAANLATNEDNYQYRLQETLYYYYYPKLQAMVVLYFEAPAKKNDDDMYENADSLSSLCFPYTSAQQEALVWVVQEWVVQTTLVHAQLLWYGNGWRTPGMDNDSNNLADQDPIQQLLDQLELYYAPKQWLQTMVMVLMVQSLGLDMESIVANNPTPPPFFDDDDDDHGSTGTLPLSPLNMCGWKGLQCSIDQQLRGLVWNDEELNLHGSIPLELALMTQLQFLDLSNSPFLVGTLPVQLLRHVQALYLQQTSITGLGDFEQSLWRTTNANASTALTDLRISAQQGPLNASTLTILRNLIWLEWNPWRRNHDDDDNTTSLSTITTPATIPTEIGYLTRLQGLSMEGNGLSGAVPTQLAQLTSLVTLDFSNNQLDSIPSEIGLLQELEWLSLANNTLSTILPSDITNLSNLKFLELGGSPNMDQWGLYIILSGLPWLMCACGLWTSFPHQTDDDQDPLLGWEDLWEALSNPVPDECTCRARWRRQ